MNSNLFWKFHAILFGCAGAGLCIVGVLNWWLGVELNPVLLAAIIGTSAVLAFSRQPD